MKAQDVGSLPAPDARNRGTHADRVRRAAGHARHGSGAAFQPVLAVGGAALFFVQTENNAEALVPDIAVRGTGGCQTEGGIRRSGGVAQSQKQRKRQHEP